MTSKCICCGANEPFFKKGVCHSCYDYVTKKLGSNDIAIVMSSYHHRHPEDKEFAKIFMYAYNIWSRRK